MKPTFKIIRSSRKTLAIEVTKDCEILVRAPRLTPVYMIESFVSSHEDWLTRALARQNERRKNHPPPSAAEIEQYREKAKRWLPSRVSFFSKMMGVTPTGVRITNAQKRFGSCSAKNSLCFSLFLMGYPDDVIDYVIVHELSHIMHHDHSAAFWKTVETYMPDYKDRRKQLWQ